MKNNYIWFKENGIKNYVTSFYVRNSEFVWFSSSDFNIALKTEFKQADAIRMFLSAYCGNNHPPFNVSHA